MTNSPSESNELFVQFAPPVFLSSVYINIGRGYTTLTAVQHRCEVVYEKVEKQRKNRAIPYLSQMRRQIGAHSLVKSYHELSTL